MKTDPNRVIVVCGFPRSGTSLLMQMLNAAGVRCAGEHPAFEDEETMPPDDRVSRDFVESYRGGAFKFLDPHRIDLPQGFGYDFVWTTRDPLQQAASNEKFMRATGLGNFVSKHRIDRPALADGARDRTESLWLNYAPPVGDLFA